VSPAGGAAQRLRDSVTTVLRAAFGPRQNGGSVRAEIEHAIAADEAAGAALAPEERAMLRAILKLGDMRVDDVMVPRADIEAVDLQTSVAEIIATLQKEGHSRMPVYRESLDDPVGMIHIKDVLGWIGNSAFRPADDGGEARFDLGAVDLSRPLKETGLVRPLLFVPPSMPARLLLQRMQASRTQMALVIDEYGGTDGLVSLEDLVEIIVGEIEDEHDLEDEVEIQAAGDGLFIADARASIEEAQKVIGPHFTAGEHAEDVDTVGGLVFAATGRIPVRGEIVHAADGFEFEILDADPRRIKRIRIRERRKGKAARPRARVVPPSAAAE
jgi:CBS domain containing-hemolysin-like protein